MRNVVLMAVHLLFLKGLKGLSCCLDCWCDSFAAMSAQLEVANLDLETEIKDADILGKHLSSMMGVPRPLQNSTGHAQSQAAHQGVSSSSGGVLGLLLGRENPASVEQHLQQDGFSEIIVWLSF